MLKVTDLVKTYRTGDRALDGVSFEVPAGQVVGLIGPSGAGKSTLIRCVNRLVEPSSGSVHLGELDVTSLPSGALRRARRRIGMIFQEYALVERLSVMENVLSGRLGYVPFWRSFLRRYPEKDVAQAFALLERVGLGQHADKRADALSGGQRQRVGIARALEQDPELLLVDEPTASLDPKTSRQIMRLIVEICAERRLPAIINIHDVVLARRFTERLIGLQGGRIVFDGPPEALDERVLTTIYGDEDWTTIEGPGTLAAVEADDIDDEATTDADDAAGHDEAEVHARAHADADALAWRDVAADALAADEVPGASAAETRVTPREADGGAASSTGAARPAPRASDRDTTSPTRADAAAPRPTQSRPTGPGSTSAGPGSDRP